MENNDSKEVTMSTGDVVEDSDATVEIKIKTLDSQTYTLRVNKCVPVPALKEQIATVTGVESEQQRLICRGKVLKDDQLLSAYHVEDGHTLHLVVRQPFTASSSPSTNFVGSENAFGHPATSSTTNNGRGRGANVVFESVNIDQGDHANPGLNQILASILSSLVGLNNGTGNARTDHREMSSLRQDITSADASLSDAAHSQSTTATPAVEFDPNQPGFPLHLGSQQPTVIPDSLTTINQYLGLLRDEFRREGLRANEASGVHESVGQSREFQSRAASGHAGLPNPSALAEILLATRALLMQQAAGCLAELARQLESQSSISDPLIRTNIQSSAVRVGILLQNLGPLLLELGRATMTLRMGQTPLEAVINAGPAIFISSSGPNPMMVQPVPFLPGPNFGRVHMGTASSGHAVESQPLGSTFVPRSIEIQIHTGRTIPVVAANQDEQVGNQQRQGQTDATRISAGASFVRPAFSSVSGNASSPGESGMQVMPMRTDVGVPAGVSPSPSDSSGSGVGLFYPLIARIQHLNSGIVNNARGSQASTDSQSRGLESDQQILESNDGSAVRDGNSSTNFSPAVSGMGSSANESVQYQGSARVYISGRRRSPSSNDNVTQTQNVQHSGQGSRAQMLNRIDQFIRSIVMGEEMRTSGSGRGDSGTGSAMDQANTTADVEAQGTLTVGEQAIFFSNLLHQLMPYLSQGTVSEQGVSTNSPSTSMTQNERETQTDSRSVGHQHDPPPDPQNAKRQKRE